MVEEPFRCRHDRRDWQDRLRPRRPAPVVQFGRQVGPVTFMRVSLFCAFLSGSLLLSTGLLHAQEAVYKAPAGEAPPVAPPLKKGSPLDHLANDPKLAALPIGYKEGNTQGDSAWIAHRLIDEQGGQGW